MIKTNHYSRHVFIAIAMTAFLSSCDQRPSRILLSEKERDSVLRIAHEKDSLKYSASIFLNGHTYLVGVFANSDGLTASVLRNRSNNGNWRASIDKRFDDGPLIFNNAALVNIDTGHYLYFDYQVLGGTNGNADLYFNLLSITGTTFYDLNYSYAYDHSKLVGGYTNADSLKAFPSISNYLRDRAEKSSLLPGGLKTGNMTVSSDSAVKKWVMLNEGVYEDLEKKDNKPHALNIEVYGQDILPKPADYDNDSGLYASNVIKLENRAFRVYSQFKGPVYVFDKRVKKSFVIWAPANSYDWVDKIAFKGPENLLLFPNTAGMHPAVGGPEFEINLSQKTIKRTKH